MMEVRRNGSRPWRIGHRGAAALAPENTIAGMESALEAGVDFVELDVLPLADGTLVLAHSDDLLEITHGRLSGRLGRRGLAEVRELEPALPTLDEALAYLAGRAPDTGLVVDVKGTGFEAELSATLRRHRLSARTAVSSAFPSTLRRLGELEPEVRLSLSYPLDRRGVSRHRALRPVIVAALLAMRAALPLRIERWLESTGATVATLHYLVASPTAIRACHRRDAAVFVWTVDDEAELDRAVRAGADGVITNDPGIFRGYPV